jgi:DNA-binding NtrC family response regulator
MLAGHRIAGRYRVEGPLGEGAQGSVWRVVDEAQPGAPALAAKTVALADAAWTGLLRAEFEHQRGLSHPGLVGVVDFVVDADGRPFLLSRVVEGRDLLAEAAAAGAPSSPGRVARVLDVAEGVLRALEHLHARGLCHLDVKPAHVVLERGQPVLLDLGLAARSGEVAQRGTPGYVAPEVALGHPVDRRADLYSLGVTLLHAITGVAPAPDGAPDPGAADAAASGPARAFVSALLRPDRTARPASASAALALLGRAPEVAGPLPPIEAPFAEREQALARLLAPLEAADADPVALVVGPRGAGRSRLLREAATRTLGRGAQVVLARFDESPARGPFGALAPLLTRLGVPLTEVAGAAADLARARVLVETRRRATLAADAGPLVLALDDVDAAPEEALEVLGVVAQALRARGRAGAALWLTLRDDAEGPHVERLRRELGAPAVVLPPFAAVVAPDERPLPAPGTAARAALEALALTGGLPARLLDRLAPLDADVAPWLRTAPDGRLTLARPELAQALREATSAARRDDLAARALTLLDVEGDAWIDERADLALVLGDAALAGPRVLAAARRAVALGALGASARRLERLLALSPDAPTAAAALELLADLDLARGDGERAVARWREVHDDARVPARDRAAALARAARQRLRQYRDADALDLACRAEALLGDLPAPDVRCDVASVRVLEAAYRAPHDPPDEAALAVLRGAGAPGGALAALGTSLGIALYRASRLDDARRLLERARDDARGAADLRDESWAVLHLAVCAQRAGDGDGATRLMDEARRGLEQAGDVRGVATADLEVGLRLLRASRYHACVALLDAARTTFEALGDADRVAELRMNLGAARLRLGDLEQARAHLLAAQASLQDPGLRAFALGDLALLAAERGDEPEARARLEASRACAATADAHFALQAQVQRAVALLRLGRAAEALEAARAAHATITVSDLAAAAATARAEAALAAGDAAQALEVALAALPSADAADRARLEAACSGAYLARGDVANAESAARRAVEAAAALDDVLDRLAARLALVRALVARDARAEASRLLVVAAGAARAAGLARRAAEAEALLAAALGPGELVSVLEGGGGAALGGGLLAKVVAGGQDAGHMLDLALGLLVEATGAERGLLVLLDEAGAPAETAARNMRDQELHGPQFVYSRRLVMEAATRREPVLVHDALSDPRFSGAESVASLAIRSVLAVPAIGLRDVNDASGAGAPAVLAVLYLDDRAHPGRFGDEARELAGRLTAELTPAFRLVRERAALERKVAGLSSRIDEAALAGATEGLIGASAPLHTLRRGIARAARTDLPVLIEGESGSGKELIARAVHAASRRAQGPFVAESCAAVHDDLLASELFGHVRGSFTGADQDRRGIFEAASGGTLFLDEVSSMSASMQAKLLRVLQEGVVRPVGAEVTRKVDVRVIAASNEKLTACVAEGRFRGDLYYRLAVVGLAAPALRERTSDVPLLFDHFVRKHLEPGRAAPLLTDAALRTLTAYPWPGNVRELENVVRRLLTFRLQRILVRHLPDEVRAHAKDARPGQAPPVTDGLPLEEALETIERELIERALRQVKGNVSQAARLLQIERTKLNRRLAHLEIDVKRGRAEPEATSS